MNYATIKKNDVANGEGVRVSLFVSGCTHHCDGCFNSETWDFEYGEKYTEATEKEILSALGKNYIRGLSLLGGEPFEPQNQAEVLSLARRARSLYPEKDIWCYSGYLYEELSQGKVGDSETCKELLSNIDVLIDGEFIKDKKDLHLRFRGSSNQRIIDVKKSLKASSLVMWDGETYI
ncbi:MAG: anaerobic ribonucleoside-triphosphate reductase activating protein [Clostridia bacterium]|nr:anaerobic ribonucleoside-triphosphate reductase activating protein [Clostridia bacterium]MEE1024986.1 anaerobic ribonucleoside-triphosphate reductase activating protein [Acutalibacteraceae bacterium]